MNKLKICTLTVLFSTLAFAPESRAATIAPSIQVKQAAQWFTGFFDNAQQVASKPSVPFITTLNCKVELANANPVDETENIYLEQRSSAFNRIRFYSFSEADSGVKLSIRSFVNPNILSGICNNPQPERIINNSNILETSCDLLLMLQNNRYIANNAPNGCPSSSGGKVVSSLTLGNGVIDSLDQIFDARGNLIVSTPIEFRRFKSIPESSNTLGLLALGMSLTFSRKQRYKSTDKKKAFV
ncbi:MAG: CpeT/CpcT protein [Hassallia sp. WJT32-NPBG1]|jgi:hypothetical protein|nr:CpeT/CpcT protein [Spirirestis rafaelensis WJT71-NPBG6]MBW4610592.1 CpeT/CpcT protein [Hassallia sp. WJT32-NPBG1]